MKKLSALSLLLLTCCHVTAQISVIRPPSGFLRVEGGIIVTNRGTGLFTNLLDALDLKLSLAGQLGGSVASPDVRGVRETGGPTSLTFGAIADGQLFQRSGNSIVGASASGTGDVTASNILTNGSPILGAGTKSVMATNAAGFRAAAGLVIGTDVQAQGNYLTALTSDVTASGPGSAAATIANDAVTNAKQANMAQNTIKGRVSAGTGDPEDLTPAQSLTVLESGGANIITAAEIDTLAELNALIGDADVPALAGQLGGTAASPDVRGIRETSGPTLLTVGSISDGQYLLRSGSNLIGGTPSGSGANWIGSGSTNSSLAGTAFANNGVFTNGVSVGGTSSSVFTNGITDQSLTASRAVATDSNKKLVSASTTATELGYVNGVTSAIQTQIDSKAALAGPTFTGDPKAPTASPGDNDTSIATTAFVTAAVAAGGGGGGSATNVVGAIGATLVATTGTVSLPIVMPYAGHITGYSISADGASPTATFDVFWEAAGGTALPSTSIMGTKPALSTGNVVRSTSIGDWTTRTNFAAGDIYIIKVDTGNTVSSAVQLTLETIR